MQRLVSRVRALVAILGGKMRSGAVLRLGRGGERQHANSLLEHKRGWFSIRVFSAQRRGKVLRPYKQTCVADHREYKMVFPSARAPCSRFFCSLGVWRHVGRESFTASEGAFCRQYKELSKPESYILLSAGVCCSKRTWLLPLLLLIMELAPQRWSTHDDSQGNAHVFLLFFSAFLQSFSTCGVRDG